MNDYERWLNKYFKAVNPIALHTPWGASYMVEIPTSFSASGVMIKEDKWVHLWEMGQSKTQVLPRYRREGIWFASPSAWQSQPLLKYPWAYSDSIHEIRHSPGPRKREPTQGVWLLREQCFTLWGCRFGTKNSPLETCFFSSASRAPVSVNMV